MGHAASHQFSTTPAQVMAACDVVRRFCAGAHADPEATHVLTLCVEELGANIVNHAFAGSPSGIFRVQLSEDAGVLQLVLSDSGPAFNPLDLPPPDLDGELEDREVGGLGVHLVRSLADTVTWARVGEENRVTVRVRRSLASTPGPNPQVKEGSPS